MITTRPISKAAPGSAAKPLLNGRLSRLPSRIPL
jgi:hypothetical protein